VAALRVEPDVCFTLEDAQRAAQAWGANCGPGAIAAVLQLTLDEVRPHLHDFERKRYTNPALMYFALRSLGVVWHVHMGHVDWPVYGLARVQWEGPWLEPGVPIGARYRRTHWVGTRSRHDRREIFDINCMCVGGWVSLDEWSAVVVPWLLRELVPGANGRWHLTHAIEVEARLGSHRSPLGAASCR
jgi:hypothetical protein